MSCKGYWVLHSTWNLFLDLPGMHSLLYSVQNWKMDSVSFLCLFSARCSNFYCLLSLLVTNQEFPCLVQSGVCVLLFYSLSSIAISSHDVPDDVLTEVCGSQVQETKIEELVGWLATNHAQSSYYYYASHLIDHFKRSFILFMEIR